MTDTAIEVRKVNGEGKMRAGVVGLLCGFLTLAANLATAQPAPDGTAAWDKIARVLTSPRCLNCHPRDDLPTQGETMKRHRVAAPRRGPYNHGVPAMRCSTCHQEANQEIARTGWKVRERTRAAGRSAALRSKLIARQSIFAFSAPRSDSAATASSPLPPMRAEVA